MTQEISFISAGEDEKEAISFLLKFVEEKFLELASTPENKINLRCNDASQASEIDQKLWEDLNDIFLAHKIYKFHFRHDFRPRQRPITLTARRSGARLL